MERELNYIFTASCCFLSTLTFAQKIDVKQYLPEAVDSYKVTEWLDYEGEELYDYINGGAELYLSYGLKGMTGCKYNAEGLPQITVEIYEMTSSANAFGIYTQSRDKEEHDYGQGSQSHSDYILFWKGKYYIIITAQKPTTDSSKTISHLASLLDKATVILPGDKPAIIQALPPDGLAPAGYLYFHHYVWLNAYHFIADYNIVNITDKTHALLAKYGSPDDRSYLLIVEYPQKEAAMQAWTQLKDKFAPEATSKPRPQLQLEDRTWFTTWTDGVRLYAIFNASTSAQADNLYNLIHNKQWKQLPEENY